MRDIANGVVTGQLHDDGMAIRTVTANGEIVEVITVYRPSVLARLLVVADSPHQLIRLLGLLMTAQTN